MEVLVILLVNIMLALAAPMVAAVATAICLVGMALLAPLTLLIESITVASSTAVGDIAAEGMGKLVEALVSGGDDDHDASDSEKSPALDGHASSAHLGAVETPSPANTAAPSIWQAINWKLWRRRLLLTSAISATGLLLVVLLLQTFLLGPLARRLVVPAAARDGIQLEFVQATGNLFVGRLHFRQVRLQRDDDDLSNFDLNVEQLSLDVDMSQLLLGNFRFDSVRGEGIAGSYTRVGKRPPDAPKRPFEIGVLTLIDSRVRVVDTTLLPIERLGPLEVQSPSFDLTVERAVVTPFRSSLAVFDALFHSEVNGAINGHAISASSSGSSESRRRTEWVLDHVKLSTLTQFAGGASQWLPEGELSARVSSEWSELDDTLPLHCLIGLHDVRSQDKAATSVTQKLAATAASAWLKRHSGESVEFDASLPRSAFEGKLWLHSVELGAKVGAGMTKKLLALRPNGSDDSVDSPAGSSVQDRLKGAAVKATWGTAKALMDRFRAPQ
ncbi:MAG: hypothetical protein KDB14_18505 [Planctomycetales bacterium]|nr:hypothetical protein [Planctomycetales bacterium]